MTTRIDAELDALCTRLNELPTHLRIVYADCLNAIESLRAERNELRGHVIALLDCHGKPHRDEWINDDAYKQAIVIYESAKAIIER